MSRRDLVVDARGAFQRPTHSHQEPDPQALDGNVPTLNFDQALNPVSVPPARAFRIAGAVPAAIVDSVAVVEMSVVLKLRDNVPGGTKLTVSYDDAADPPIRNLRGPTAKRIDARLVEAVGGAGRHLDRAQATRGRG